MNQSMVRVR